jgi:CRISPR-associated endonuclease/helicase Cas3
MYFEKLYWQKGRHSLDAKGILQRIADSDYKHLPMETLARDFRMITTVQQPIIVGWGQEARKVIDRLRYAEKAGGLARQLQPYLVQVPQNAYTALRKAGAVQPIKPDQWGEQFMELVNMNIYSEAFGLWWEDPTLMDAAQTIL